MLTSAIAGHGEKTFRSAQFSHRLEVYQRFIHIWGALSAELDTRKDLRLDLDFKTLEDEFILLASPKVLKAFNEWKKVAVQEGVNTTISKNTRQDLLLCMREDLGQPVDYFARKEIQLNR